MIAIFTAEADAIAFDAAVSAAMGWPNAATKTERYAIPRKHQTLELWAMPVEDYAEKLVPDNAQVVLELPPDWGDPGQPA